MRIVFIRPCCIGDVVLATGALTALRQHYPHAHITWAVSGWAAQVIAEHPALDATLNVGSRDLPVRHPIDFGRFVLQLRRGQFDLAVSLVRSRLMTLAVQLSGIPRHAGINSAGRGAGYTIPVFIDPLARRHEAKLYLDVIAALGANVETSLPTMPVSETSKATIIERLQQQGISEPYVLVNPAGGSNPGMSMHHKRWPPAYFAAVIEALRKQHHITPILVAGPQDGPILDAVVQHLTQPCAIFAGGLSFSEVGALAAGAFLYLGNDTGLTHLAAASGARTAMILGPSDPLRYGPVGERTLALWKPIALAAGGVANSVITDWDWTRDGIDVDTALAQIDSFLRRTNP